MHHRLLTIVPCLFVAVTLFATETEAEADTLIALHEVAVTASMHETPVIPPQQLEGGRLQTLSVHSIADAVRYFAGVQIKDYGGVGGIKTIDLRSMGTHHVGVFYDGIEVGNAQNGVVDLGKFSLENIESLSLYNGQRTEALQPAKDFGSAGTLYIKSRRPQFVQGKPYNLSVTMKAGSFGLANPSILYEQRLTDDVHLSANAEYTYATGRYHFRIHKQYPDGSVAWDTTGIRQNGDIQAFRGELGLYGYLPDGKWHIKGYYYQSEKGIPRAIIRNVWTSAQRQWDRNAFVQGAFQYNIGHRWQMLFSAKYANDKMRYLNPDTTLMYVDNTFLQQEVYVSWANSIRLFDWWHLSLSGDYIYNTLASDMANFVYPTRHSGLLAAATTFDYRWIKAQASVLTTLVQDHIRQQPSMTDSTLSQQPHITPAVFISYQPMLSEQLFLRAFYKQIFRMPTFNDLYYTDIGNIALEPETSTQYDVGVSYTKQFRYSQHTTLNLQAKVDGYFNQVKNKIIAVPKGNSQYRWMMMNIGYVEIRGVDVSASVGCQVDDWRVGVTGTYTYQRAQDFSDPSDELTYGGQIAYIPWHSCSALVDVAWRELTFTYSFIYVGERYHNSANIPANYEQPWYTHDMAIGYRWTIDRGVKLPYYMQTTVEINNLLNQQYEVIHNYPMPGLNGRLVLRFIM